MKTTSSHPFGRGIRCPVIRPVFRSRKSTGDIPCGIIPCSASQYKETFRWVHRSGFQLPKCIEYAFRIGAQVARKQHHTISLNCERFDKPSVCRKRVLISLIDVEPVTPVLHDDRLSRRVMAPWIFGFLDGLAFILHSGVGDSVPSHGCSVAAILHLFAGQTVLVL